MNMYSYSSSKAGYFIRSGQAHLQRLDEYEFIFIFKGWILHKVRSGPSSKAG
jgi:hypothetical protein